MKRQDMFAVVFILCFVLKKLHFVLCLAASSF